MASIAQPQKSNSPPSTQVRRALARPQFWFGLAVFIPFLAWYVVFFFRPVILGFWMAITDYNLLNPAETSFVGLDNFRAVFEYERFWIALKNTLIYGALTYLLTMPAALLVAWAIVSVKRGRRFYEFVVFLPVVVSLVAISLLFRMLMNPEIGVFNQLLETLGLPTSRWVDGSGSALLSVVLVDVWKGLGFYVVLFSTAMLNVPEALYDAARVDGADGPQLFRHVTLPSITNTLLLVSVIVVVNALQVYVSVTILGPGPGTSTLVLNQFIIAEAFNSWQFGVATAASLVLFVIILGITLVQLRVLRPQGEE